MQGYNEIRTILKYMFLKYTLNTIPLKIILLDSNFTSGNDIHYIFTVSIHFTEKILKNLYIFCTLCTMFLSFEHRGCSYMKTACANKKKFVVPVL